MISCFFFFNDTAPTEIFPLSLHDALPIWIRLVAIANRTLRHGERAWRETGADAWRCADSAREAATAIAAGVPVLTDNPSDRKSTRLNSRHPPTSYAVFFFEKKNIP